MLSQKTIELVKSTAPLLVETGPSLTAYFYDRMFNYHPELKDIFNMSNQFSGAQREALFNAIYGYAANIDNLEALLPVIEKIAQKHVSFNISPDMCAIVGENLLATIDELLSPDQEVLGAWAEAYAVLAQVLPIEKKRSINKTNVQKVGGAVRVILPLLAKPRRARSSPVSSLLLKITNRCKSLSLDSTLGSICYPEQFKHKEIRQYSLSSAPNVNTYRISVKRDHAGTVSNYLHDHLSVGDSIKLAPPSGDFFLNIENNTPIALISGGVGLTPLLWNP